jgi:hypothetical protein
MNATQTYSAKFFEDLTKLKLELETNGLKEGLLSVYKANLKKYLQAWEANWRDGFAQIEEVFVDKNVKFIQKVRDQWKNCPTDILTLILKDIVELMEKNHAFMYWLTASQKRMFSELHSILKNHHAYIEIEKQKIEDWIRKQDGKWDKIMPIPFSPHVLALNPIFDKENPPWLVKNFNNFVANLKQKYLSILSERQKRQKIHEEEEINHQQYRTNAEQQNHLEQEEQKIPKNCEASNSKQSSQNQTIKKPEDASSQSKSSQPSSNPTTEEEIDFEALLSQCHTYRLPQNPMMTQEERISFIKNNQSQLEYSQIQNPIEASNSQDDEILFVSLSQLKEYGIEEKVPEGLIECIEKKGIDQEEVIPMKINGAKVGEGDLVEENEDQDSIQDVILKIGSGGERDVEMENVDEGQNWSRDVKEESEVKEKLRVLLEKKSEDGEKRDMTEISWGPRENIQLNLGVSKPNVTPPLKNAKSEAPIASKLIDLSSPSSDKLTNLIEKPKLINIIDLDSPPKQTNKHPQNIIKPVQFKPKIHPLKKLQIPIPIQSRFPNAHKPSKPLSVSSKPSDHSPTSPKTPTNESSYDSNDLPLTASEDKAVRNVDLFNSIFNYGKGSSSYFITDEIIKKRDIKAREKSDESYFDLLLQNKKPVVAPYPKIHIDLGPGISNHHVFDKH